MAEPLAVLLLPCKLEEFKLADHARALLAIPRVVALEPPRRATPRILRDTIPGRQAKRLRFPGEPRLLVLYDPRQYPLARALCARHEQAELWYGVADPPALADEPGYSRDELLGLDALARERARQTFSAAQTGDDETLRRRLVELEVISSRPFVPGARIERQ